MVELDRPDTFECLTEHRDQPKSMTEVEEAILENILEEKYLSKEEVLFNETKAVEALALLDSTISHNHLLRSSNRRGVFKASQQWTRSFRKRHRLSVLTTSRTHVAAENKRKMKQQLIILRKRVPRSKSMERNEQSVLTRHLCEILLRIEKPLLVLEAKVSKSRKLVTKRSS